MSVSYIPDKTKFLLWGKSAGRCQYEGCNKILWQDLVTRAKFSTAYIAHIIADKEGGPRGDKILSERLKADISNLMLLCDTHHRLIDKEDVAGHPVERLQEMKKKSEARIQTQTSLGENKQSHILHYVANVGKLNANITWKQSYTAMSPNKYPAEDTAIDLSLKNSSFQDKEPKFWEIERENLQRQFAAKVQSRLTTDIQHLSVFAIAPQPLLMELGRLLSDISAIDVFQHQKEPEDNWVWQDQGKSIAFKIIPPDNIFTSVAFNISLSGDIDNQRILSVLGKNTSIWTLTIDGSYNDFLKTKSQLSMFRETFRKLLNKIKHTHGQNSLLNIFPAAPVSIAVEIGRVWMPKADLPLRIYDQNSAQDGFIHAFDIDSSQKLL